MFTEVLYKRLNIILLYNVRNKAARSWTSWYMINFSKNTCSETENQRILWFVKWRTPWWRM